MLSRRLASICLLSLFGSFPAQAQDDGQLLQPAKPWILDYGETQCSAERTYAGPNGHVTFGIRAMPSGDTYELLVARPGRGPIYGEQQHGTVDLGSGPKKAWLIRYGVKGSELVIQKIRISAAEMTAARSAKSISVRAGRTDHFAVRALPALLDGLQNCVTLLRRHWNMVEINPPVIATPASGSILKLFNSNDYPAEAISRWQEGTVTFLLLIDQAGRVAHCNVHTSTGIPALEVMGCQVIRTRARFAPARDKDGKAVRSVAISPPISWRIAG